MNKYSQNHKNVIPHAIVILLFVFFCHSVTFVASPCNVKHQLGLEQKCASSVTPSLWILSHSLSGWKLCCQLTSIHCQPHDGWAELVLQAFTSTGKLSCSWNLMGCFRCASYRKFMVRIFRGLPCRLSIHDAGIHTVKPGFTVSTLTTKYDL